MLSSHANDPSHLRGLARDASGDPPSGESCAGNVTRAEGQRPVATVRFQRRSRAQSCLPFHWLSLTLQHFRFPLCSSKPKSWSPVCAVAEVNCSRERHRNRAYRGSFEACVQVATLHNRTHNTPIWRGYRHSRYVTGISSIGRNTH